MQLDIGLIGCIGLTITDWFIQYGQNIFNFIFEIQGDIWNEKTDFN